MVCNSGKGPIIKYYKPFSLYLYNTPHPFNVLIVLILLDIVHLPIVFSFTAPSASLTFYLFGRQHFHVLTPVVAAPIN